MFKLLTLVFLAATTLVYAGSSQYYSENAKRRDGSYQNQQNQQYSINQQNNVDQKQKNLLQLLNGKGIKTSIQEKLDSHTEFQFTEPLIESLVEGSYNLYKNNRFRIESVSADNMNFVDCMVDPEKVKFIIFDSPNRYVRVNTKHLESVPQMKQNIKLYVPGIMEIPLESGQSLANEYEKSDSNVTVVVVDYSEYKNCSLKLLIPETLQDVGRLTAVFIVHLLRSNYTMEDVHVIANQVGIHAVEQTVALVDETFPRVTALDPCFTVLNGIPARRQDGRRSVDLVDVIYVNLAAIPESDDIPYALFFPNGGLNLTATSNDGLALKYYRNTINNPKLYKAARCDRYATYKLGLCKQNPINWMGEHVQKETGTFFLSIKNSTIQPLWNSLVSDAVKQEQSLYW